MTEEQYLTFQKFNDNGLAIELAELLTANNIDSVVEDTFGFRHAFYWGTTK